jgi:GAF domain-containing protein
MSALAFPNVVPAISDIRLDSSVAENDSDHVLLLDVARLHSRSETAVIYQFRAETSELLAIAARSSVPARVMDARIAIGATLSRRIEYLPGLVQGNVETDLWVEKFPDVVLYQVKRLAIAPLRAGNLLLGLLILGRLTPGGFHPSEIQIIQRAARLLAAVLERDSLHEELAARKVIERAKGILQQRRRVSEEHAYLLLRNTSRRRRIRMADLSKEIIEGRIPKDLFRRWQVG